jgi:nucleotide-binding universal stress UspA family protein
MNLLKEDKMKILVGYDGSKVADDVIKLAHKHAKAFKADVVYCDVNGARSRVEKRGYR